jgi:mono/diheme cytochrome c family protein
MRALRVPGVLALALAAAACSPSGSPAPPSAAPGASARVADGARLYAGNCAGCHQPNGQGIPRVYPSLSGSPAVLGDPGALAAWIVKGRRSTVTPAGRYPTVMPQFVWLKIDDTASLLTYLRASFGNHGAAVDPASIAPALDR